MGVLLGKVALTTLSFELMTVRSRNYRRKTGVCRTRKDRENAEHWGGDVGTENPCLTENLTGVNLHDVYQLVKFIMVFNVIWSTTGWLLVCLKWTVSF